MRTPLSPVCKRKMSALSGRTAFGPSGLAMKSTRRRGQVRVQALGQPSINVPSTPSEQHFGTNALEQFEKAKLGDFSTPDLTALTEQLKERGEVHVDMPVICVALST